MPVRLNLNIGNVQAPGPRTQRTRSQAGEGLQGFGKTVSNAVNQLKNLGNEEDDVVAMDLSLQFSSALDSGLREALDNEPNIKKHRKLVDDTTLSIFRKFATQSRKLKVPQGFIQRSAAHLLALKNQALVGVTQSLAGMASANISRSENLTLSSLIDARDGRIPTVTPQEFFPSDFEVGGGIAVRLLNEDTVAAKVEEHFKTIRNNERFLPDDVNINQLTLDFSQKLLGSVLESVAKNHTNLFTNSKFHGAKIEIEIPVIDFEGNFGTKLIRPTQDQINKMTVIADAQQAHDIAKQKRNKIALKEEQVNQDDNMVNSVIGLISRPTITPNELSKLFQHLVGNTREYHPDLNPDQTTDFIRTFTFHDPIKQREAQARVQQALGRGGAPRTNHPEIIANFERFIFDEKIPSPSQLLQLKENTTRAKYSELWNLARGVKSTIRTRIGKVKSDARKSIGRLLGAIPGISFKKGDGVVADKVERDFMARVSEAEATQPIPITSDQIWTIRNKALESVFGFIKEDANLTAETLNAISHFEPIQGKDARGQNTIISPADQIVDLYMNSKMTERSYRDALFYMKLKQAGSSPVLNLPAPGTETSQLRKLRKLQEALKR